MIRDVLSWIGATCVGCFLLVAAWITSNEVSQRSAARRAARAPTPEPLKASGLTEQEELEANMLDFEEPAHQNCRCEPLDPPIIAYYAKEASPHPLGDPVVYVGARSEAEAWAAISRRAS